MVGSGGVGNTCSHAGPRDSGCDCGVGIIALGACVRSDGAGIPVEGIGGGPVAFG